MSVGIIFVDQLYPWPEAELQAALDQHPTATEGGLGAGRACQHGRTFLRDAAAQAADKRSSAAKRETHRFRKARRRALPRRMRWKRRRSSTWRSATRRNDSAPLLRRAGVAGRRWRLLFVCVQVGGLQSEWLWQQHPQPRARQSKKLKKQQNMKAPLTFSAGDPGDVKPVGLSNQPRKSSERLLNRQSMQAT